MNDPAEELQQALARLEQGDLLADSLTGLDEPEARLVQLAAALQATPFPHEDDAVVAAQRAQLLRAAGVSPMNEPNLPPDQTPTTAAFLPRLLDWLRTQMDTVLQRRELALGLAATFALVLVLLAGLGVFSGGPEPMAEPETPSAVAETEAEQEPPTAAEPPATAVAEEETTAEPAVVEAIPTPPSYQSFLPLATSPLFLSADTATLEILHGRAEVQTADGSWTAVAQVSTLGVGQRVRTGPLSSATLTFYDGSQATLSADSELSIDQLTALRPEEGFRTVVLTQHMGESEHSVEFRNDGGSRYEVNTPAGSGIARGTKFRVIVTPGLLAQFATLEGKVDVTGLNQTVSIVAGQTTAVLAGSPPQPAAFRIYGEGEVSQIGAVWVVAGQSFQTNNQTIIMGNPQMGDLVRVDGRLADDGSRTADRIVLIRRAEANRFALTGELTAQNGGVWVVAGQTILITDETEIDDDDEIEIGDQLRVQGVIMAGGALRAEQIEELDDDDEMPFRFTGLVEVMGDEVWIVSGVGVAIRPATAVENGIALGDVVEVRGRITAEGTWIARRISQVVETLPEFSFTGRVQSIDPWLVAGIAFGTAEWTAVDPELQVGHRARVRGVVLADGSWVASSIERLGGDDDDDDENNTIVLVGVVGSMNPWVVNGLPLFLTDDSKINGNIAVGDVVRVKIRLSSNGLWEVIRIRPLHPRFGLGCFIVNTTITGVSAGQLTLQHWPALTLGGENGVQLVGSAERNGIVALPLCFGFNGTVIIIGPVIIIYQPIIIILPPSGQPPRGNWNGNRNDND